MTSVQRTAIILYHFRISLSSPFWKFLKTYLSEVQNHFRFQEPVVSSDSNVIIPPFFAFVNSNLGEICSDILAILDNRHIALYFGHYAARLFLKSAPARSTKNETIKSAESAQPLFVSKKLTSLVREHHFIVMYLKLWQIFDKLAEFGVPEGFDVEIRHFKAELFF